MNDSELFDFGKKATIGLHHLKDAIPDAIASGCLINYLDRTIILTVAHAVAEGGWGVKLEITKELRQMYFRTSYSLFKHGIINEAAIQQGLTNIDDLMIFPEEVDMAFAELPKQYKVLDELLIWEEDNIKICSRPKYIFNTNLDTVPMQENTFTFFGEIRGEINKEKKQIITIPKLFTDIKYNSSDEDLHYFILPSEIKDFADFQGCSGAPIFNEDLELVSLVAGGYKGTKTLYGINLAKYKFVIDTEFGIYN
jgi:hypothetical protein